MFRGVMGRMVKRLASSIGRCLSVESAQALGRWASRSVTVADPC